MLLVSSLSISSHATYMESLFADGRSSNITIVMANDKFENGKKIMKLHRLVLGQSPYFEALFHAQWLESGQDTIEVKILDDNITERCESFISFSGFFQFADLHFHSQRSTFYSKVSTLAVWSMNAPRKISLAFWQQLECLSVMMLLTSRQTT